MHDDSDTHSPHASTRPTQSTVTPTTSGQDDVHAIAEILHQHRAQLHHAAAELVFVESIMNRVRDAHQQILDKHSQILASLRAHQGLVSCIRRLPAEILREIFVWCLPRNTSKRKRGLSLMGVCERWRKVALGTPRLWCSLSVQPGYRRRQQGLLLFYGHWLSRARGCPLSLAVDIRLSSQNPSWWYEVTEVLVPYTSRAVRLHITFENATVRDLDLLLKDVPMLENLTLKSDLDGVVDISFVIVQPEPRLRSLTLDAIEIDASVRFAFQHCWTHLTRLRVRDLDHIITVKGSTGLALLTLLTLCPHLQDFVFCDVEFALPVVTAACALTHSNLRSFEVRVLCGTDFLLDKLTLPSLMCLKIRDSSPVVPSTWRQNEFREFLARSRCPLETLHIYGWQALSQKEDRAEYAALIPTLKQLRMEFVVSQPNEARLY